MSNKNNVDRRVSFTVDQEFTGYPDIAPFNAGEAYPEYRGDISSQKNPVYAAVRENLRLLGFDSEDYGTEKWNPLSEIINHNETVLIKPNFVLHKNSGEGTIWSVITHPSVIRAVVDYVYLALGGTGKIIIADAPQADAEFDRIMEITQIEEIVQYYRDKFDFKIEIRDLRQNRFEYKDHVLLDDSRITLSGDPEGYTIVDLKEKSWFEGIENLEKIYGADYDRNETRLHHNFEHHEYCIANSVLNADVVISLAKMKTHRKAGVTLTLKNFIGINGNKNYLPHFRIGEKKDGGDEFESLDARTKSIKYSNRFLTDKLLAKPSRFKSGVYKLILKCYRCYKKVLMKKESMPESLIGGGWYGNDTLWRTILDLFAIIEYGGADGEIKPVKQRKVFGIIDGMISGEGNGPLAPMDKKSGIILMGRELPLVDLTAMNLMNVDFRNVKVYERLFAKKYADITGDLKSLDIRNNLPTELRGKEFRLEFAEPDGWKGKLCFNEEGRH